MYVYSRHESDFLDHNKFHVLAQYPKVHHTGIFSLAITKDGRYIFSSGYDGYLRCWDVGKMTVMWDYGKIHPSVFMFLTPTET